MVEISSPDISVDEIMARIRDEVVKRKAARGEHATKPQNTDYGSEACTRPALTYIDEPPLESSIELYSKEFYDLDDFIQFHDKDFVVNAYHHIMRRYPDESGLNHYLTCLRKGLLSKIDILGRLRYSPEGRKYRTKIRGLPFRFAVRSAFRVPIIGRFLRIAAAIGNLPVIWRKLQIMENDAFFRRKTQCDYMEDFRKVTNENFEKVSDYCGHLQSSKSESDDIMDLLKCKVDAAEFGDVREELRALRSELETVLKSKVDAAELALLREEKADKREVQALEVGKADAAEVGGVRGELKTLRSELEAVLKTRIEIADFKNLSDQKADRTEVVRILRQIRENKREILDQNRRLHLLLEEARKRLPKPISKKQIEKMAREEDHLMDAFYVSYEDQFRGTREDIKDRLKIYLPYVQESGAGTADEPILDLGCGRGEWVELCADAGLHVQGVDINRVQIDGCRDKGLNVIEGDAVNYLRNLRDKSVGAVTAFHFVEHLQHDHLMAAFDEVMRVLRNGGLAIIETPNPENIFVGACLFYSDMSHVRPLVPESLKAVMELKGFVDVTIKRLHKYSEYLNLKELTPIEEKWFYSEMDYALIARKPE